MKQQKYKVMISMNHLGEVLKAACQCPAGRGVDGLGHCNHVGGILFAVEDFCRQGLKEHGEPVSCTSRLCSWNAPRNVQVDPEPVNNIVITKYRFGKKTDQCAKVSLYDPRAPADRRVNPEALSQLSAELSNCLQSSCYFLFHNVSPQPTADENVQIDCICETVPENAPDIVTENDITDLPFSDDYDISSSHFKSMMDYYADTQSVSDVDIEKVERVTRGQSNNEVWRQLKRDKLIASNFHDAAVRRKEPDKFLRNIMYISEKKKGIASLEYDQLHEGDAVASYVAAKAAEGNTLLRVEEVGTILSKERPGYGASLDRKVYDPKASGMKVGGLEAKCPYCKRGMTVEQACKDPNFCLYIDDDGLPKLKFGHKYYYQVQGQMYVCNLEWVDFVVWFGGNNVFIQRIYFNNEWWYQTILPRLDFFYKRAFLPEIFTRRIERGVKLYKHGGWRSFQKVNRK
ncbi:uncharacterized protein [Montipora foliosa]|uniref:uncharacterized protein n=1 Tax=Montipora foliosa TaxID=591990 RepID=UPI0035F11D57